MAVQQRRAEQSPRDAAVRAALIERHLPLVKSVARRFERSGEPLDDLIQVGTIGLIKAIDRFDPARGNQLSTVAVPAIEGEIRHHLRDRGSLVRTPQEEGAAAAPALTGSLDEDGAAEPRAHSAEHATESRLLLDGGLDGLPEREQRIVRLRYEQDLSQAEIARREGISQATVSRLLQGALDQMRRQLGGGEQAVAAAGDGTYSPPVAAADKTPEPAGEAKPAHSGRLLVRMPASLHDELASAAEREGVSLNTLVTGALAGAVRWRDGSGADGLGDRALEPQRSERPAWLRYALLANVLVVAVAAIVAIALLVTAL